MKKMSFTSLLGIATLVIAGTLLVATPTTANAATGSDFQAGNIISDGTYFNSTTMNKDQIQNFLNAKVPSCRAGYTCLRNYVQDTPNKAAEAGLCNAYGGGVKTGAQIIADVSAACGVNPQTILTLLQKESSLVTDSYPDSIQYRSATGYGCPDTAACDSTYYGFFNQVYMAARSNKVYAKYASSYNYRSGRNNSILYNPQASCGRSDVVITSQATAGLYNYTPYRPNQAALNNLYGTGDSCSAYGNRNFWRIFSDWFGSATGGVQLVISDTGTTTYAVYDGIKQGIPSQDVLNAWGLNDLPTATWANSTVVGLPERSVLTRLVRNPNNPSMLLLADNGGFFNAWPNMISNFGLNPGSATDVGLPLLASTRWSANLSHFVLSSAGTGIYMVDGGTLHNFASGKLLTLWGGPNPGVISVSPALFATLSIGQPVFTNQTSVGSNRYLVDYSNFRQIPTEIQSSFSDPNTLAVSQQLFDVMPKVDGMTPYIQGSGAGIYLADSGEKMGFASPDLLKSYTPIGQSTQVTRLTDDAISMLPDGDPIVKRFAYTTADTSKTLFVDGTVRQLPASFESMSNYGIQLSQETINRFTAEQQPLSCGSGNGFIEVSGQPGILMLEGGKKRGIGSLDDFAMLNPSGTTCKLSAIEMNSIPDSTQITPFVISNGVKYVLEGTKRYSIPESLVSDLGNKLFTNITTATLNNYQDSGVLNKSFIANGRSTIITSGSQYSTTNTAIASAWKINSSQTHTQAFLNQFRNGGELTLYMYPSSITANYPIYTIDDGKFIGIPSIDALFNIGYSGQQIIPVRDDVISQDSTGIWQGYLAKSPTGSNFILEGGRRHPLPDSLRATWLGSGATIQTPTTLTDNYLSTLQLSSAVTKSITDGNPGIYGMVNGQKSGIPNTQTYLSQFTPALTVSRYLVNSIPTGQPIPSV